MQGCLAGEFHLPNAIIRKLRLLIFSVSFKVLVHSRLASFLSIHVVSDNSNFSSNDFNSSQNFTCYSMWLGMTSNLKTVRGGQSGTDFTLARETQTHGMLPPLAHIPTLPAYPQFVAGSGSSEQRLFHTRTHITHLLTRVHQGKTRFRG